MVKKIYTVLISRVARNIYFWLFLFLLKTGDATRSLPTHSYYALLIFNLFFFIVPCTLNSMVLIPWLYVRRKWYTVYIGVSFLMVFGIAFIYTAWLKYLMVLFPGIDVFDVSVVSSPLTDTLTVQSVLAEMSTDFFVLLTWYLGFTGMWFMNDYGRKTKMMEAAVKKQIETELNFLKSQINPHFLFNTLNNVYALALKKSDDTPEVVLKLSSILRYILYDSNSALVSFEKEKEMMQAYIDIELLRIPETSSMNFSILSDRNNGMVPPLLWMPVLENVFKHGTHSISNDYFIDFRISIKENRLSIFSKNSYKLNGQQNQLEKPGGIGLDNLKKRLDLLYPGKYEMKATAENGFYTMEIQIDLA